MPAIDSTPHSTLEQANELYWNSERTVEEITRELRLGRSTLYAGVRPIPAGMACPDCADPMVFTNRSNRDAGTATCPACTVEAHVTGEPAAQRREPEEALGDPGSRWSRWRDDLAAVSPQRVAMVGSAAALGAVIGAIGARALRG